MRAVVRQLQGFADTVPVCWQVKAPLSPGKALTEQEARSQRSHRWAWGGTRAVTGWAVRRGRSLSSRSHLLAPWWREEGRIVWCPARQGTVICRFWFACFLLFLFLLLFLLLVVVVCFFNSHTENEQHFPAPIGPVCWQLQGLMKPKGVWTLGAWARTSWSLPVICPRVGSFSLRCVTRCERILWTSSLMVLRCSFTHHCKEI